LSCCRAFGLTDCLDALLSTPSTAPRTGLDASTAGAGTVGDITHFLPDVDARELCGNPDPGPGASTSDGSAQVHAAVGEGQPDQYYGPPLRHHWTIRPHLADPGRRNTCNDLMKWRALTEVIVPFHTARKLDNEAQYNIYCRVPKAGG